MPGHTLFSQHISRDNYTGDWEVPDTWNLTWLLPQTSINAIDITINGYVTLNGSLTFYGGTNKLIVNDTLVIHGDLILYKDNDLIINDNGILIVRGNFALDERSVVNANGYFIITGNVQKNNTHHNGFFTSNDNPVKLFIGGSVAPWDVTIHPNYPVLKCLSSPTDPYINSGCSYGNMTDITVDPVFAFFESTCADLQITGNTPICAGDTINLVSSGGNSYLWNGPMGFTSTAQNPSIPNADVSRSGSYILTVTGADGCTVNNAIDILVNDRPIAVAGSNSPICEGQDLILTGSGNGTYEWNGSAGFTSSLKNPTIANTTAATSGIYILKVATASGCSDTDTVPVIIKALPIAVTSSNSPVCEGNTLDLSISGGLSYEWIGPEGFSSINQNPSISDIGPLMTGKYTATVTAANGCTVTDTLDVTINALPLVTITSSENPMCLHEERILSAIPSGGNFIIMGGPGDLSGNVLTANGTGDINLKYNYTDICTSRDEQVISVHEIPVANAGPDQDLNFVFETTFNAQLPTPETGEWSKVSGSGNISDIHSPTSSVSELSAGINIFLWTVTNGYCQSGEEVIITVTDLFVPSVITPNGDGLNDYFKCNENIGLVKLIIFNRWGIREYSSDNYLNDWNGRNARGEELPNDTYFYVLNFENGQIKKGTVLIIR